MAAPLVTKNDFRKKVWDHLEKNDLAEFPRPVHNRIPNFKGGAAAAHSLSTLEEFQQAKVVKVNPDKAQETVRFLALEAEKTVLVPTPRLRHGLFNRLTPPGVAKADLRRVARAEGISKFSTPVGLDNIVPVDLIVVGSVAVSKDGYRIGKGEGYADLEYAMARGAGAVTEDTIIITTVHDDQVFATLPSELFGSHDITVDVIVTPTQVIRVSQRHPKPTGIIWKLVTPRKLKAIPVLKALRDKEAEAGKDVTLGEPTEMELDEIAARKGRRLRADGEPGRPGAPRRRRPEMGAGDAEPSGHSDLDDEGADKRRRRRPVAPRRRRHVVSDAGASDAQEEPEIDTRHRQQRRRRRPLPPPPPQHEPVKRAEEEQRRPRARRERPPIDHSDGLTVIVRRIPSDARPRDLREAIGAADSPATIFSWKGRQGMALLRLRSAEAVKHLLEAAEGFKLVNEEVQLERYEQKARPAPQTDRPARSEKPDHPERAEKAGRGDRADRGERAERGEKGEPVKRERRPKREDRSRSGGRRRQGLRAISQEEAELTVFIGRLPASTRVRELRAALVAAGAQEPSIAWKGWRGMAFVRMKTAEAAEALVAAADQLKSISDDLVVERYKGREHYESDGGVKDAERAPCKKTPKDKARDKSASAGSGDEERVPPADVNADDVKEVVNGTDTPASDSPNNAPEPAAEPVKPAAAPVSDVPTKAADAATKPPADAKPASVEEAKSTPAKTEPTPVKTEPVPSKPEPAAASKVEPAPSEAKSTPAKVEPTPAKTDSVPSKDEPAKADTAPAKTPESAPAKTPEPVPAKTESTNAAPVPADAKPEAAKAEVEKKTEEPAKKPEEPVPAAKAEVPVKTEEPAHAKKAEEPAPAKKVEEPAPAKKAEEVTPAKTEEASPTNDAQTPSKTESNAGAADPKPSSPASDSATPAAVKTEPSETAAAPAKDSTAAEKPATPAPAPKTTDAAEKASGDAA